MNHHTSSPNTGNCDFKMDFNIDSLRFRINFADKIADIERTMKEDRLLVEQLFVNQMDTIKNRMETQERTIKSCEALMELEATNDSFVENKFNALREKIDAIEITIRNHETILHNLNAIVTRHNNTLVTHFELNEAYCGDLVSGSRLKCESNAIVNKQFGNGELKQSHHDDITKHTQMPELNRSKHSNDIRTKTIQEHSNIGSENVVCSIRTQPLRIGRRNDYQRIHIHVSNRNQYNNESEIRNSIARALVEYSNEFNAFKFVTCKLKYEPDTHTLTECSFILLLPKPIHMNEFNRFLSQHGFQIARK